ncbi:MAG TPA: helix-turn-helix domain-containing protein [Candidatus Saccharibacteria bacterium]|nr:helix-turn-helix domain-containing protein [Candidatus Saccharibacteria bacterium]
MSSKDESIVVASLSAGYAMLRTLDLLMTAQSRVSVGQLYEIVIGLESVPEDYLSGWTGVLFPANVVHEPGPDGAYAYQLRIHEPARAFSFYDKPPTVETFEHELEGCSDDPSVIRRAVEHIKRNKKVYIFGAIALVGGLVLGTYLGRTSAGQKAVAKTIQILSWKPVAHTTLIQEIHLERRGHPGNIVKCLETGEVFASQNRAADVFGIPKSTLSKHLDGLSDHARGFHFERLAEAS